MSVVQNVLIGRAKQKIGNAVFTTWKGINVLKSKPITVENPNTINQQMRRSALTTIVEAYRVFSSVITVGWKELAVGKSEYNAFVSYNLRNAFDYSAPPAATPIPASVAISRGTITQQLITTGSSSAAIDSVVLNWDSSVLQPGQSTTDKALVVIDNATSGFAWATVTAVNRSADTLTVTFPYPITVADVLHCYLGFYNTVSGKAGDSDHIQIVAGA